MTAIWGQYARYNHLANETLYAACAGLSGAEYRRDLGAFFGSVHGTLNHLLLGDTIWMARFEGGSHPSTDLGVPLFDKFDALREAREHMDRRIERFFSALPVDFENRSVRYVNNSGFDSEDPLAVILPVATVMFGLGYLLQRVLLNRTLGPDVLPPLLVTFGFSILIQNGLLEVFTADSQALQAGELSTASLQLGAGISIGLFPLLVFGVSLLLCLCLNLLFNRTSVGMALRATSDDPDTAGLMGIRSKHVYALAMGLSFALVAVGGVLCGVRTTFTPASGPASLLYAFEAVVIGGMGSLWGTFAGAVILGIAHTVGAEINVGFGILFGHLVFLAVLVFKPTGLFARTR